jgi:hypothetical protein
MIKLAWRTFWMLALVYGGYAVYAAEKLVG